MKLSKLALAAWICIVVLATLLLKGEVTNAAPISQCKGWSIVSSPNVNGAYNILSAATAVSASDVWAVGGSFNTRTAVQQTLIEQWNGTSWSIISSPNVQGYNDYLNGVAALSAHNIWTVGSAFDPKNHMSSQTLTEFHC